MKTYAKEKKSKIIDWELVLKSDNINWDNLKDLANNWNTCSVGQLSNLIERTNTVPTDYNLKKMGNKFSDAIDDEDIELSLFWLKRVKEKGAELLKVRKSEIRKEITCLKKQIKLLEINLKK